MRSSRFWPLLACLLVAAALSLSNTTYGSSRLADQRNVIFDRYTTEHGLSHPSVTAITQDQYGFIWIGTQEGLNRFDGYKFETFYHRDDIEGSISSHAINDLVCDSQGTIWIGTDGGLNRLNDDSKHFESFKLATPSEAKEAPVLSLFEDTDRTLWIGTTAGLFARYADGRFESFHSEQHGIGNIPVRSIYEDSRNNLYIATDRSGLLIRKRGDSTFTKVDRVDLPGTRDVIEDLEGNIWVAGNRGGLAILNPENGGVTIFEGASAKAAGLTNNRIRKIMIDRSGDIWIGSGGGLLLYDEHSNSFTRFTHDDTDTHSLSDNNVIDLFQDTGGVIWAGTFNGLSKFNAEIVAFPKFRRGDRPGLLSDATTSFAHSSGDDVWVGTFVGLHKWNGDTLSFSSFTTANSGLSDNRVMSLATTDDGLWVGTMTQGVNYFENEELIAIMQHDPLDANSISSNSISSIHIDKGKNLWFATYGGGVNLYLGEGKFRRYPDANNPDGAFSDLRVLDITDGPNDTLWIATDGGGVISLDPKTGVTQIFRHDEKDANSISSDKITSLLYIEDTLWIGTIDNGLNRYSIETNQFQHYNRVRGLASDLVYGLLTDQQGNIWISGGKGLSVLNPETGRFQIYDSTHGLQGDDFNGGAYLSLPDGTFLFGGNNGFNAFYPDTVKTNDYIPPIRITQLSKFNKAVELKTPIYKQSTIELNHNDSVFGFEFAAMDYTAPHKNRFRYRLEGFDRGWTEADTHQVTYTNLDAGNYLFRVQGANNDGVWNEVGTSIEVVVLPPIWATWWAYAIYLAVALILVRQGLEANQARLRREAEKRYSERLQLYIESLEEATDTVLIADANKNLLYANNSIEEILGVSAKQAEGRSIMSLLFNDPEDAIHAREGIHTNGRWHGEVFGRRDGEKITTDVTISAVRDENQNETAFVSIARDITQRKKVEAELEEHRKNLQHLVDERTTALKHEIAENKAAQKELANSLEEKELLLKEVHHRVKNNMQVISSLLNIQAETVNDDIFSGLLGESQQRIKSMSLIHENLYQSENLLEIDFEDYINSLANSLHRFYRLPDIIVGLDIQVFNVALDIETAVPCGLIINELISNAFKHAFKGRSGKGKISVIFKQTDTEYVLTIEDDGNGLPEDFSLETQSSMGTEIVVILTHQLDGNITFKSENGAQFRIAFPKKEKVEQLATGY